MAFFRSEASALKDQVRNLATALDDERQKREEMSSQHMEEMSLLKGKVDILLANGTVKDLAMSQLNSQHITLDNTCVGLRTDVDKLDYICSDLQTDVENLGRRSCRQENDVNEVACRVLGKCRPTKVENFNVLNCAIQGRIQKFNPLLFA